MIECPYCEFEQEVNHNDGENYEQDVAHQMDCSNCKKTFVFYTNISFSYESKAAPCLNGQDHLFKPTHTFPKEFTKMRCVWCDEIKDCAKEELKQILNT